KTREEMVSRWREGVEAQKSSPGPDGTEEVKEIDYPEHYETLGFEGLTFRFPPELREAVKKAGPRWSADLRTAQAVFQERFGGPWKERQILTEEDFEGMGRYGVDPVREEAVMWSVMANLTSNIEKWALKLISGDEVGVWFREDMVKAAGDVGRFGGIRFDVREGSASFGMPNFRWGKEIGPDTKGEDLARMIESQPTLVFAVFVKKEKVEGKTIDEQVKAMEEGDLFLRGLSRGAAELDPKDLGGRSAKVLSDEQSFFVMVHEAIESALVRQVIGSRDRRWFCDGLANLVAIRECDRRFGEGTGMKTFESMFDPGRSRGMAKDVDLLAWPAVGDEDPSLDKVNGLESAHYFFATVAMLEAVEGQGDDFVRRWVEAIRKTPWNRTNAETVMAAYRELAGKSLKPIVSGITADSQ
ncbi:MAG: hypothetical protein KDN19_21960, partial [Verrucomicrobiae bacterium]|nr:hypothetical protein [Verrucomicrobiae bacterium]